MIYRAIAQYPIKLSTIGLYVSVNLHLTKGDLCMTDHEIMRRISNFKYVLDLNFSELEKFYTTISAAENALKIVSNEHNIRWFYCNSLRYIMNYMSAWYALKSIFQAQMKEDHLSVSDDFRKKYTKQIEKRFSKNDFSLFFEDCRNVFIHEGIPFAKLRMNLAPQFLLTIMIDVAELQKSSYFGAKGSNYIEGKQEIDFFDVCKRHYTEYTDFYTWFNNNIQWNR